MPDDKMPNRVALFLDGTWNTTNDNTNVWRLKSLCTSNAEQKVYYSAGVGTQRGEKLIGGAFGIQRCQRVRPLEGRPGLPPEKPGGMCGTV